MADFNPRTFYLLFNPVYKDSEGTDYALSAGIFLRPFGAVNITVMSLSSQNWQLFPQGGRYFIRNYDYGAGYQLGLTKDSGGVPTMLPRSGSLGQQWSIMQKDGGWQLTNGLLGNGSFLAVPADFLGIAMQASSAGTTWNITRNPRFVPPYRFEKSVVADNS